jgi:CRISPR-associated protein Cas5d
MPKEAIMKSYPIQMEVSGPTAMWTRPDTGDAPVSYPAPTYAAVKGMFESILWLKNAEVIPLFVEICAPVVYHTYTTNYGGPLRKPGVIKKGGGYQLIATVLVNVCYKLYARVESVKKEKQPDSPNGSDNNGAHAYQEIFQRRLSRGQCHTIPFLGWKEFAPDYVGPLRDSTQPENDLETVIPSILKTAFPNGLNSPW